MKLSIESICSIRKDEFILKLKFGKQKLFKSSIQSVFAVIKHYKKSNEMGPTGFEPATTRLRAKRSPRLSYGPM